MPKVSVIIPLYQAEKYVEETINSVLYQTYQDFEVIVVDDCGGDNSVNIVNDFKEADSRIILVSNQRNRGIAYSRNKALSLCRGEYIALLDDDDLMMPERLQLQVEYLDKHPEIGAVGGNAQWIDEDGNVVRETIDVVTDPDEVEMYLLFRNIFNNSEMMFRKSVIDENGVCYADGSYGMEDFKFWIDYSKVSRIVNIPDMVLKKRCLDNNETSKNKTINATVRQKKYLEFQKYSLEKSGYRLLDSDLEALRKYFGEDDQLVGNYGELAELLVLFDHILTQTEEMKKGYIDCITKWFDGMLIYQNERMLANKHREHLSETMNLREVISEQQEYIHDLLVGKEWLEKHCEDMEKYIQELIDDKK